MSKLWKAILWIVTNAAQISEYEWNANFWMWMQHPKFWVWMKCTVLNMNATLSYCMNSYIIHSRFHYSFVTTLLNSPVEIVWTLHFHIEICIFSKLLFLHSALKTDLNLATKWGKTLDFCLNVTSEGYLLTLTQDLTS